MDVDRSRAFDFVETVRQLPDVASILDAMSRTLSQHGFDYFCSSYVTPLSTETPRAAVLAERLPAGFLDMYSEAQYVWHDPALRYCRTTLQPFRWFREAPYDPEREPRAVELVRRARDFGMVDGVVIPVISPAGRTGQVWFGGAEIDLPERDLPALHLMALYAFDRVLKLRGLPETPQLALSSREREVLTLAAVGRSSEEIADALAITGRTVKAHIKSCCKKLGAATRTQAVMIAMRDRIISP
ncbi:helix-turn-helix transcriptional regulator [Bradyrhizobium sp. cf659]|uniref:helix-turn-helix transcriptional regulator n=1 Tax=Bradyrhizobium sp. cf659 TaxID=1761771 RepID=UPI0008E8FD74|nr:LuxR family transcriptional regulator [Bradyrhizobium sp. cf659]SFI58545.1 LuxR family transcriptional regulator, quorum sensing-dependent transcriptional regulator [Bradyrhizobium sp. cf659]